jgi:hypothetical protein
MSINKIQVLLTILILNSITFNSVYSTKCKHKEYECKDKKRCIPRSYICNGVRNCRDGSDENKCSTTTNTYTTTYTTTTGECRNGKIFSSCGSPCEATCVHPNPQCIQVCATGCFCPKDKPIYDTKSNKCVTLIQCATLTSISAVAKTPATKPYTATTSSLSTISSSTTLSASSTTLTYSTISLSTTFTYSTTSLSSTLTSSTNSVNTLPSRSLTITSDKIVKQHKNLKNNNNKYTIYIIPISIVIVIGVIVFVVIKKQKTQDFNDRIVTNYNNSIYGPRPIHIVQSIDNISTDNISTDNISTDNISTDNISTDNISTDNISTDNIYLTPYTNASEMYEPIHNYEEINT